MYTSCLRAACASHDVGHLWFTLYEITNGTERNGTERSRTGAQKLAHSLIRIAQFTRHTVYRLQDLKCYLTRLVMSHEYGVDGRMNRE